MAANPKCISLQGHVLCLPMVARLNQCVDWEFRTSIRACVDQNLGQVCARIIICICPDFLFHTKLKYLS